MLKTVFKTTLLAAGFSGILILNNAYADCSQDEVNACILQNGVTVQGCNGDILCEKDSCVTYGDCLFQCCGVYCNQPPNQPPLNTPNPYCSEPPKKLLQTHPKAPLRSKKYD